MQIQKCSLWGTAPAQYKPLTEKWTVEGDKTYDSTQDLVSRGAELDGHRAVYRFTTQQEVAPFSRGERLANAVGSALIGGTAGAGAGLLGGIALGLAVCGSRGIPPALIGVPVALGATAGAVLGGRKGAALETSTPGAGVEGVLKVHDGKVSFRPAGKLEEDIDLKEFQSAPVGPLQEALPGPSTTVSRTLHGAVIGAALPASMGLPIVGWGAGAAVGMAAGATLDRRTTLGAGLGLTVGLGASVATVVATHFYGAAGFGAVSAALGLAGACLGNQVFSVREGQEAHHTYGRQWWNQGGYEGWADQLKP